MLPLAPFFSSLLEVWRSLSLIPGCEYHGPLSTPPEGLKPCRDENLLGNRMTGDNQPTQPDEQLRRESGVFASRAAMALQFSVLLALAALAFVLVRGLERTVADKDALIDEQITMINELGGDTTKLAAAIDQAIAKISPGQDRVRFLSELVQDRDRLLSELAQDRDRVLSEQTQARDEVAALRRDRDRLARATRTLDAIKRELQDVGIDDSVEHAVNRLIGIATEVVQYEEAHGPRSALRSKIAELSSLLEKRDQEVRKTKGLSESLKRVMERARRVTQKPPCWVNAQTRKQEYIFDVALLKGGFVVRDRRLPHRAEDQAALPLQTLKFETFISSKAFLAQTSSIFAWSKARDCRFFARAFDVTGAQDKQAYKAGMRILEQRFYKYEVRDENFSLGGVKGIPVVGKPPPLPKPKTETIPARPAGKESSAAPAAPPAPAPVTIVASPAPAPRKDVPLAGKQEAEESGNPIKGLFDFLGLGK